MTTSPSTELHTIDNARLADGQLVRLRIADGRFVSIEPMEPVAAVALVVDAPGTLDLQGLLLLPTLVDGHLHLDKTLMGLPWMPHPAGPNRMARIEAEKALLPTVPLSTRERANHLIRACVAQGTGVIRSHVDIDPDVGLRNLEGVLLAREDCRGLAEVQLVAFPQSGVVRRPGTLALLDAAVLAGAEVVGGIDPSEIDGDPAGQLDGIFAIAERRGVGVDVHVHEWGELGLFTIRAMCERTRALGLGGKVTVSHGYCLGQVAEGKARQCAELMGQAGVALMTHGAAAQPLPPLSLLRAHGVTVFAANDGVRDLWSPYGNGDVLARAALVGWRADWRRDEQIADAFDMVTGSAARAIGVPYAGIAAGAPAHGFAIAAGSVAEAVCGHPPRRVVLRHGKVVARDGVVVAGA